MNDLLRLFLLFTISIVAFSQYLRSSASTEVEEAKDRLRAFEDWVRNQDADIRDKAINHSQLRDIREQLYSQECKVPNDTGWYYIIFSYLSFMIGFASIEKFFEHLGLKEYLLIQWTYTYDQEISGAYVLIGLFLCLMVFRAGFKAISPKGIAKRISDDIDAMERVFRGFNN
jgi:hypothetical protein